MGDNQQHVIFGTGPLGIATAEALLRRGRQVTMVNRSGKAQLPEGVTLKVVDLNNVNNVAELAQGASAVYHCAQPLYHHWLTQLEAMQRAIIEGIASTDARLIVAENVYMYGQVNGPIHEDLPYKAHTRKGQLRARLTEQLAEAHAQGRVRMAAIRGSNFFGPHVRESAFGERVFPPILQGKAAQLIGRTDVLHSFTYIGDFGEAMAIAGERDEALGKYWHVPNAPAITQGAMIDLLAVELGRPIKINAMGKIMLSVAGLFIPSARETVEMLYEYEQPFIVDGSRFERAFAMQPTPIGEALHATLAWYRTQASAQQNGEIPAARSKHAT